jgi:hypothetical protein
VIMLYQHALRWTLPDRVRGFVHWPSEARMSCK